MKLMIVDDDEQIRTGMEQGIDWSALNIDLVITASNGLEALEKFKNHSPEIIVTDVRMPGMDGLELLRQIKKINPQTRVIILSGYNDFEYLKTAIQLDAADYEMKPIRARSLIALIQKIKEEIIRQRMSEQEFYKYLQSYKNNFGEELLLGRITDRLVILEGLQQYYGFEATGAIICVYAQIDYHRGNNSDDNKVAMDMIHKLFINGEMSEQGVCLRSKEGEFVFLFKSQTQSYLFYQQYVNQLINELRSWNRELKLQLHISLSFGVSRPGYISDFKNIYGEAQTAFSFRLYEGNGSIYAYGEFMELEEKMVTDLLENGEFLKELSDGDLYTVTIKVNTEFERLKRERRFSRKCISAFTRSLLQLILITIRKLPNDLLQYIQNQITLIEENSDDYILDEFRAVVLSVLEEMRLRLSIKLSPVMARADEFIRKNFTSELTVEMLSEYVGKTPNYFSHLFKREFGVTFKEYVTKLRITKAKEMILNSNDHIYEISEKVGFTDYTYFTQVFKKTEGYTPAVLRKQTHS